PRGRPPRRRESELPLDPPAKHAIVRGPALRAVLASDHFLLEPRRDEAAEDRQTDRAGSEHGVVEALDVEPRTEGRLRGPAEAQDLELSALVRQRLAGPHDVAIDLVGDVVLAEGRVALQEVDRLAAGPAERVHARVHDEPPGAPRVERQDSEAIHV